MKKYYVVIISLLVINSIHGQLPSISDLECIDNQFFLNDSLYTGEYACFFDSGSIKETGIIKSGYLDSISRVFDKNGEIIEMIWYENGLLKKRRQYAYTFAGMVITTLDNKDKLHGLCEKYFSNGTIKERQYFKHGEPARYWTTWDKKERVLMETNFDGNYIVRKIHQYRFGKHKILVQHFDKNTNKVIYKEWIRERSD